MSQELKDLKAKFQANSNAEGVLKAGRQEAVEEATALHAKLQRLEKQLASAANVCFSLH